MRLASGFATALLVGLMATGAYACSPADQNRPGAIVYGSPYQPNTLNPITAPDIASRSMIEMIFDGLVAADDNLTIRGELATAWETSGDGLLWTFHLRRGVRWHDGREFTAGDVEFTYETIIDPDSRPTVAKADYASIRSVEVLDPYTVRFRLARPNAAFLSKLVLGIAPRHLLEGKDLATASFNHEPVGTGPFVFENWRQGESVTLRRNPDYFGAVPKVDKLIWKVIPDGNALSLQTVGGQIDAAPILSPRDVSAIRDSGRMETISALEGNTQISLQLKNPLLQDVRVRQALAYGIDRRALIDLIMQGQAVTSTSDILPGSWAYNPDVASYSFDRTRAGELLAQAGWKRAANGILEKNGARFELSLMTDAGHKAREQVMLAVRQNWRDLGIDVTASLQERNSFVSQRVLKGDFDAVLLQSSVQVDPDLSRRFHSDSIGNGQNFVNYRNPQVDWLLERALASPDQERRREAYFEVQSIMAEELPQISLFYPKSVYAVKKGIEGVRPSPANLFWNAEEWRWR